MRKESKKDMVWPRRIEICRNGILHNRLQKVKGNKMKKGIIVLLALAVLFCSCDLFKSKTKTVDVGKMSVEQLYQHYSAKCAQLEQANAQLTQVAQLSRALILEVLKVKTIEDLDAVLAKAKLEREK